jgi:hypothetical protein
MEILVALYIAIGIGVFFDAYTRRLGLKKKIASFIVAFIFGVFWLPLVISAAGIILIEYAQERK